MENDKLICCELVFDGGDKVLIPPQMGTPKSGQLEGSIAEQLSELAGRICYDSLGSGRGSKEYHEHILQVGHGSVYEHYHFCVEINADQFLFESIEDLLNRPGVFSKRKGSFLRITANLRAVLEWSEMSKLGFERLGNSMWQAAKTLAPLVFSISHNPFESKNVSDWKIVPPDTEDEQWISLLLSGSRGMSHEQVRHGDWTGISQRSSRFCDESNSDWVRHPLYKKYQQEEDDKELELKVIGVEHQCKGVYEVMTNKLQNWLMSKDVDKTTARKQARGAARGILGNSLHTELIFSASVRQWKHMITQRCSRGADAEIRELYRRVLETMWASRYGDSFRNFKLIPSPDGIGFVVMSV